MVMFFAHLVLICAKKPLWIEKKDGNLHPDLQLCLNFMKNLYICMGLLFVLYGRCRFIMGLVIQ